MDFGTATEELANVEKNAMEYAPPKEQKEKMERLLEVSPSDVHELEYGDMVNQYYRLEKIIVASSRMRLGTGEGKALKPAEVSKPAIAPAILKKEAIAIEKAMKKISAESAKETQEISAAIPAGLTPEEERIHIAGPAIERAKSERAAGMLPEETHEPAEIQKTISSPPIEEIEKPEEAAPAPEEIAQLPQEKPPIQEEEISAPEEHLPVPGEKLPEEVMPAREEAEPKPAPLPEPVPEAIPAPLPREIAEEAGHVLEISLPPVLATSPLENAQETITRLEAQLSAQMTGKTTKKVDTKDTKKRMMELTRELFKERSTNRRAEIKKEIVALKALLTSSRSGKAAAGGLPKGSLFAALKNEQEYELKEAKNKIQQIYEENKKRLLAAMSAQRALEHRGPAFETFSKNMVELEHQLITLIEKYQLFLVAEHTSALSKLVTKGQATEESEKLKASTKELYAHDFSSLKESIGEDIHSQLDTTRAALFEDAGDPQAVKLAQISNAPEESLFNLLQAKDSRTYERYARGEIDRSEALLLARKIMAKEAGIDEDTIIKCFGRSI